MFQRRRLVKEEGNKEQLAAPDTYVLPTHRYSPCYNCSRIIIGLKYDCSTCEVGLCQRCFDTSVGHHNHCISIQKPQMELRFSTNIIHEGAVCDACEEEGLRGVRMKCAQCPDYDLCLRCYQSSIHSHHTFFRLIQPVSFSGFVDSTIVDEHSTIRLGLVYGSITEYLFETLEKMDRECFPDPYTRADYEYLLGPCDSVKIAFQDGDDTYTLLAVEHCNDSQATSIAGYAIFKRRHEEMQADAAHVISLAVKKDSRKRGVGRQLLLGMFHFLTDNPKWESASSVEDATTYIIQQLVF
eukprot:GILJ01005847.1.p1 GENE.GILJ01005847.1~~GILJ01005847.1.p1  ORF type:complete len:297 (+),score=19.72 GILJ01005847.1:40-930(+)